MSRDLALSCACAEVAGYLEDFSAGAGTHVVCHCSSCRAGEVLCGAPDPGTDGVGIFQTSPHMLRITRGIDQLSAFSFGRKNLLRWRARCCGVPMFTTLRNPRVAFVGIRTTLFADTAALGPVVGHAYLTGPDGKTRHEGLARMIRGTIGRVVINRITGRWRRTPFFDIATGEPVAPVEVISATRRSELFGKTP